MNWYLLQDDDTSNDNNKKYVCFWTSRGGSVRGMVIEIDTIIWVKKIDTIIWVKKIVSIMFHIQTTRQEIS